MLIAPDLARYKCKVWLDEQTRNACTRKHILKSLLACIATVSLWFRSKERQRNDEERDFFLIWPREKWNVSLTLIPCSLRRNRSETAPLQNACYILCRLKVSKSFCTPITITITVTINIIIIIGFRINKNQSLQVAKISFSPNCPSARLNCPQTLLSVSHTAGFTLQNNRFFFSRFLLKGRQAQGGRGGRNTRDGGKTLKAN